MKLLYTHLKLFLQSAALLFVCTLLLPKQGNAQAPVNDACAGAVTLTPGLTCTPTAGTLFNATSVAPAGTCGGATTTTTYDVYYKFTATSTNHTITLAGFGANLNPATTYVQLYTGACGSLSTFGSCQNLSQPLYASNFTVGTSYTIRVYSVSNPNTGSVAAWAFTICVTTSGPPNDNCSNATLLTSGGLTCTNTSTNMNGATVNGSDPGSGTCTGTILWDVWFKFVAISSSPTITISGTGASFPSAANTKIQILSGVCGSLSIVSCNSGSYTYATSGLTVGNTYYVRIFSTVTAAPINNGSYSICITDPTLNDLCSNAVLLIPNGSCTNTGGQLTGATSYTAMTGVPGCGTANRNDVWYKFIAQSTNPIITLTVGTLTNPAMTLFSGNCASFSSLACGTTSINATGLTIGATYYIRVYSTSNATGTFNICVVDPGRLIGAGNSYVNVSKRTTGGVVQNGDTLEIRSSYYFNTGYDGGGNLSMVRYYDSVPSKTAMLTPGVGGDTLLRVITNEGLTLSTNKFTYGLNDDAGSYQATPGAGNYQIRMNIGATSSPWVAGNAPATAALAGTITNTTGAGAIDPNTTLPKANSGTLITASYFVKVTGVAGDTIKLASSKFVYRKASAPGADTIITGTPYKIIISPVAATGLCPNSAGVNIASENGGTFGTGSTKERTTTLQIPINSYAWRSVVTPALAIGDGFYSIVNNLSQTGGTNNAALYQPNCGSPAPTYECANRMFGGFWEIIGDHTGTNNAVGNPATPVGQSGGYMLAVNADMIMSDAFRQQLTGLCPRTYYQYSAWIRNVCKYCGIDQTGSSTFKPGVLPNLTFSVDTVDWYSSGSVDTVGWVKKGFIFQTGDTQTVANIAIRNNAPGGGGNDWVLDDIEVSTCLPNMSYSPTANPTACQSNPLLITDTVRSIFNNYTNYKWQRSTDGGTTWNDIAGATGTGSPTVISGMYQYVATYTIPAAFTTLANDGDRYRVVVATTSGNLSNANCQTSDAITINLTVIDCGPVLGVNLLSFSGKLVNKKANLTWTTSKEDAPVTFTIEKSTDGIHFSTIATVASYKNYTAETNTYSLIDGVEITGKTWYKVIMITQDGKKKYSNTIQMNVDPLAFAFGSVVNPFKSQLDFEIINDERTRVDVVVFDMFGRPVKKGNYLVTPGTTSLRMENMDVLSSGTYVLQVSNSTGATLNKKVVKK